MGLPANRNHSSPGSVGALGVDDAHIAAHRVAVERMVDGSVAHTLVVHETDDGLKGFQVLAGIAVQLHKMCIRDSLHALYLLGRPGRPVPLLWCAQVRTA